MNATCYKIIFSKRLGTLVAVGEHATSAGKQASGQGTRHTLAAVALACMAIGCAQAQSTLNASALPTSSQVNTGKVTVGTHGAIMTINQASDKASINWNSFNIGSDASVSINQPNASAVLLNRVIGNDPSQIFGKLNANGQVILLNPNGIVFGPTGSVTASAFTASTFGLSDDDFMSGYYKYNRNGSTASVVNQGTIETTSGGYVALIGATVTNDGKIIAPQGDVVLAAAESVTLPEASVKAQAPATPNTISVRMSKRVRLELDPATVNTAVNNTANGVIVTEGGQVLLQAAAIQAAVASVAHSGQIDTSSTQQAGAVTVLAEHGSIKVDGSIKANSSGNDGQNQTRKGGDIVIGRDEETGALAKATDVSGAKLESQGGFVETSGLKLAAENVEVNAKDWLLDPVDIEINNAGAATQASYSQISNSTINNALNSGTTVTIQTTGSGSVTGVTAPTFSGTGGKILVSGALSKTNNNTSANLTLTADTQIDVNNTITNSAGTLALTLLAPTVNSSSTATISGVNLTVNNTSSGTMAGVIGNSTPVGSFTKNGAGTLSLTGANTYTGATAVKAGTLQVTKMGSFKSSTIAIDAGATFDANATTTALNSSDTTVTGAGTFKKTGSAMFTLTGTNSLTAMTFGSTFTGLIDIREGTLQNDGTRDNLKTNQGSINIEAGASLDIRTQTVRVKGLTGAGNIVNTWSTPTPTLEIGYGTASTDSYLFTGIIGAKVGATSSSPFNVTKSGSGTQILAGDNIYVGTTAINGGTLQIGDAGTTGTLGTGAVTLANNANLRYKRSANTSLANAISGTGNVYADITGAGNLSLDNTITLTGSTTNNKIDLRANGNLTLAKAISTSNNTGDAIKLVAGQALAAGDNSGGNIIVNGTGAITMASGGIAALYSGSVAGTTGISSMATSGSGKFRYNSDETTTNYTQALTQGNGISNSGVSIIYREAPTLTLKVNDVSKTYDGLTYSGGTINATPASGSLKNGDSLSAVTANVIFSGTSQGKKNVADSGAAITASEKNGKNALGYAVTYTDGTLTINKAALAVTATQVSKTYDGTTSATGVVSIGTLAGSAAGDTINSAGSQNFADKNAGTKKIIKASGVTIKDTTGADMTGNYDIIYIDNPNGSIAKKDASITGTTTNVTYNSSSQTQASAVLDGFIAADLTNGTVSSTGLATGRNAGTYTSNLSATGSDAGNYNVTVTNKDLIIAKKDASITGTTTNVTYNSSSQTQASAVLDGFIAADLTNGTVSSTGLATGRNAGTYTSNLSATGSDAGNYNVTVTNKDLIIAKKDITLSGITANNKTYDGTSNASISNITLSGFVGSESLGASATGSFDSKNAGSRTATVSTDSIALSDNGSSGGLVSNYKLVSGSKTVSATIDKAQLILLASADTKTYDGTMSSNAAVQISGLATGDSANATQSFVSKNALGTNGSTLQVNSGYVVNDGNSGNNYMVKLTDTKGTIAPKSLTPTYAEPSKKMDGNTLATVEASPSAFGVLGSDDVTIAQSATYDTPTAGTSKTVTVRNIALSGKDSGNYALKSSNTTVKGTIVAVPPIVVPPVVTPTQASSNGGKSGGGGANARIAIGDPNPFQLANVPSAVEEVCSSNNLEKCHCVESPLDKDVSICYEPK